MSLHSFPPPKLEQMDVEVHDVALALRSQLSQRVDSYRRELKRLNKEFVSVDTGSVTLIFSKLCTTTTQEKSSSICWDWHEG